MDERPVNGAGNAVWLKVSSKRNLSTVRSKPPRELFPLSTTRGFMFFKAFWWAGMSHGIVPGSYYHRLSGHILEDAGVDLAPIIT